jgi:hypothetical protein
MWSAAEGKSNIGIPQEVGKEFVGADSEGTLTPVDAPEITEYKIMEDIMHGVLPSPQKYGNVHLVDMRVTGTGLAVRSDGEVAHKSPAHYLTNEFLARCNGLPVIMEHPDSKLLDSESFRNQIIGTSSLPYIKGDDVWTIARIYDDAAAQLMSERQLSTSPAVTISKSAIKTGDLLEEGNPVFIDHIAVCSAGVWDKGAPDGVRIDSAEVIPMSEEVHAPSVGEAVLNKILERLDSLESKVDAKHDMGHNKLDSEDKDDACKADAGLDPEEKEEVKEEIEETKHVADSKEEEKADSKEEDKADAKEEKEEKKEEKEVKDDSRVDSLKLAELEAELKALRSKVADRSIEDREAMARAQSRADEMAMALGDTAGVAPLMGESVLAFRKRLATRFAKYSDKFKGADISKLDAEVFKPVEDMIYADSMAYAKAPPVAEGAVHMMETRDEAGRMIRTPTANSDPRAWMDVFANGAKWRGNIRV